MSKREKKKYLIYKSDLPKLLNCQSMYIVYRLVLTEEIIKELGFKSMKEFKNIKTFNLEQSRKLKQFIEGLQKEIGSNRVYNK